MLKWLSSNTHRIPTPEEWAERNAPITTPDRIIAEAIALSLKKHFSDWETKGNFEVTFEPSRDHANNRRNAQLIHAKKDIEVVFGKRIGIRNCFVAYYNYFCIPRFRGTTVNDVEIDPRSAEIIWNAYHKAKKVHEAIEAVNNFALTDMKRNEMAWDLVEKLLNMRRDKNGALVPVVDAHGRKTI